MIFCIPGTISFGAIESVLHRVVRKVLEKRVGSARLDAQHVTQEKV